MTSAAQVQRVVVVFVKIGNLQSKQCPINNCLVMSGGALTATGNKEKHRQLFIVGMYLQSHFEHS